MARREAELFRAAEDRFGPVLELAVVEEKLDVGLPDGRRLVGAVLEELAVERIGVVEAAFLVERAGQFGGGLPVEVVVGGEAGADLVEVPCGILETGQVRALAAAGEEELPIFGVAAGRGNGGGHHARGMDQGAIGLDRLAGFIVGARFRESAQIAPVVAPIQTGEHGGLPSRAVRILLRGFDLLQDARGLAVFDGRVPSLKLAEEEIVGGRLRERRAGAERQEENRDRERFHGVAFLRGFLGLAQSGGSLRRISARRSAGDRASNLRWRSSILG